MEDAKLVAEVRARLGLSRRDLCELLSCDQKTIGNYERGKVAVPGAVMVALSFMLLVPRDHWPPIVHPNRERAA